MPAERKSRIACLRAALFPLAAYLRGAPELAREAVVVHEGPSARIVAASRLARRAGVRPGLTVAQARNIESGLVSRTRDPEREHTAQEVLLEIADAFSPRVEDGGEGMVYLDIAAEDEHSLGQSIMRGMDAAGLPGRVGIAGSKLAARAAAALARSPNVVAPRGEARFLAPLQLKSLFEGGSRDPGPAQDDDDVGVLHTLKLWGLRTVGDLAGLPAAEVHSRLGERGAALHAAARGFDPEPLTPRPPPPTFRESQTFEWPIDNLEPFLFVARGAVSRLADRLDARGMGCKRLELSLKVEPEGLHELAIELPAPTREARTLLSLIRLHLEAEPPRAPITSMQLLAHPDVPRQAQLSLLGPAALSPDRLAAVTARLLALLGPNRVGSPRTRNGHLPERFRLADYDPPPPPRIRLEPRPGRGMLAVRTLRPPVEVEVLTAECEETDRVAPCPAPRQINPLPTEERHVRIEGAVRTAAGPWEIEEGWWREAPALRDYWDVELRSGAVCRIYRDRTSERWFADGVYD
ncbi:MAG: DNA polymerase Y family protein [Acidobacteriota bacterium]|nr:DNA polymerase Y family protein [Acidobacteriota bacterium]MDE3266026.1 DNA polymerase Y family protein [Acidobacteriota bacterium]